MRSKKFQILGPLLALFLLSFNATTAIAPTPLKEITGYGPVILPTRVPTIIDPNLENPKRYPIHRAPKNSTNPIIKELTPSKPVVQNTGHRLSGVASWYCLPGVSVCTYTHPTGGYYAAIRRDLVPLLRGKTVRVCGNGSCVSVKIIDCNCAKGANIIDLYSDAFRVLAPLSAGTVKVTITW